MSSNDLGLTYTNDHAFVPTIGKSYEIHFGSVTINGQSGYAEATIRADGIDSSNWIDLESGNPLAPEYRAYAVRAYKLI